MPRNALAALVVILSAAYMALSDAWPWWRMDDIAFASLLTGGVALMASLIGVVNGAIWYPVWVFCLITIYQVAHPDAGEVVLGIAIWSQATFPMLPIGFLTTLAKRKWRLGATPPGASLRSTQ